MSANPTFHSRIRVATLAIGTELTDGQVLDRNSKWLSEAVLETLRFECEIIEHRCVPDDREKIQAGLRDLCRQAELVLVTGGLGPTSDDFTREEIATFSGAPLEWSEDAWAWVQERLKQRGAMVSENQKQQCYFPKGASLLKNSQGTAYGFWLPQERSKGPADGAVETVLISMPGPPTEIRAVWAEGLKDRLLGWAMAWRKQVTGQGGAPQARILHLVRTMGIGEGALASGVEEIVAEVQARFPDSGPLAMGYRAHVPYVEVKIWSEPQQIDQVTALLTEIRKRYRSMIVNEGDADVADGFINRVVRNEMRKVRTLVVDEVTDGEFFRRIQERARVRSEVGEENRTLLEALQQDMAYFQGSQRWRSGLNSVAQAADIETFFLEQGSNSRELVLRVGTEARVLELPALASALKSERGSKWATEIALREWSK